MADPTRTRKVPDSELRFLAARLGHAVHRWKRLTKGERDLVLAHMTKFYGPVFVQRFRERVTTGKVDNLVVLTDKAEQFTPDKLAARGYKYYGQFTQTNIHVWVHPSGREVWVQERSPSRETVGQMAQADPLVQQARGLADESTAERDQLMKMVLELRQNVGTWRYGALYRQFVDRLQRWQDNLNWMREEWVPPLMDEVHPDDQPAIDAQLDRIHELNRWKIDELSSLIRDLPPP